MNDDAMPKRLLRLLHAPHSEPKQVNPELAKLNDQLREIYERLQRASAFATTAVLTWPEIDRRYHERRGWERRQKRR